jgi:hypothetical protein
MGFSKGNLSKVYVDKLNNMKVCVPRAIAQAMGMSNDTFIRWSQVDEGYKITVVNQKEGVVSAISIIKQNGAIITTLPKKLGGVLGITKGDSLKWIYEESVGLTVRRVKV